MITEQQDKALQELGYKGDMAMDIDKAIRWMREVKGVHVAVDVIDKNEFYYELQLVEDGNVISFNSIKGGHDIAQSAGLDAAIEYVKKQQTND